MGTFSALPFKVVYKIFGNIVYFHVEYFYMTVLVWIHLFAILYLTGINACSYGFVLLCWGMLRDND